MFELKYLSERPYHCIISVGVYPATSKNMGKMYLKYRPIFFTNDDIKKMQHAVMLSKDKLFKTSSAEAIDCVGCSELANSLSAVKIGAMANQCTLHHFSSKNCIDENTFDVLIKTAHTSTYTKQLLKDSIIRG